MPRDLAPRHRQDPEIIEIETDSYVTPEEFEACLRHIAQAMVEQALERRKRRAIEASAVMKGAING